MIFPILRLVIVNRASCEERIAAAGAFSLSKRADANMRARYGTSELSKLKSNHFSIYHLTFFIYSTESKVGLSVTYKFRIAARRTNLARADD
jgi:hypothetical protein